MKILKKDNFSIKINKKSQINNKIIMSLNNKIESISIIIDKLKLEDDSIPIKEIIN